MELVASVGVECTQSGVNEEQITRLEMADLGAYVVEVVARDRAGNRVSGCGERDITGRLTDDDAGQRSLIIDTSPPVPRGTTAEGASAKVRDLAVLDEVTWRALGGRSRPSVKPHQRSTSNPSLSFASRCKIHRCK